jgi:hypothetical protein
MAACKDENVVKMDKCEQKYPGGISGPFFLLLR